MLSERVCTNLASKTSKQCFHIAGGYAVVATSDHATDSLTESAFPLHGSDDLVNWEPKVRS